MNQLPFQIVVSVAGPILVFSWLFPAAVWHPVCVVLRRPTMWQGLAVEIVGVMCAHVSFLSYEAVICYAVLWPENPISQIGM
jgi:hypothetical protein